MTPLTQFSGLIVSLLICFIVAVLGALASTNASDFYGELVKPAWAPPGWLFGPVWTMLYIMMGVAAWLVWRPSGFNGAQLALSLFLAQLIFNALWSWLFFNMQLGMWAFVDITLLWVCLAAMVILFWQVSTVAGMLILPYILWVSFATLLNFHVWKLNPELLA
jgi:tryptophan-rich sensory protein